MSLESDRRQLEAKQRKHDEYLRKHGEFQRKAQDWKSKADKEHAKLAAIVKAAEGHQKNADDETRKGEVWAKRAAVEAKDIERLKARIEAQVKRQEKKK